MKNVVAVSKVFDEERDDGVQNGSGQCSFEGDQVGAYAAVAEMSIPEDRTWRYRHNQITERQDIDSAVTLYD